MGVGVGVGGVKMWVGGERNERRVRIVRKSLGGIAQHNHPATVTVTGTVAGADIPLPLPVTQS